MSFLRRLLGGGSAGQGANGSMPTPSAAEADDAERLHERDVLMAENERLDDLRRRQLKYADRAWTPPAQGGERRADDEDQAADG